MSEKSPPQEKLSTYRDLLERVTSTTPGVVFQLLLYPDDTLEFTFIGNNLKEVLFVSPEELNDAPETFLNMFPEDETEPFFYRLRKAANTGKQVEFEWRLKKRDERSWIKIVSESEQKENGEVVVDGVLIDITSRKKKEQELLRSRDQEERFRTLAERFGLVFWLADPDLSRFLYISDKVENLWGLPVDELCENPELRHEFIHPEDRKRVVRAFRNCSDEGYDMEYRITPPDRSHIWVHDRAIPVRDQQGNVYRLSGITEEITERKEYEEMKLAREREELDRFVYYASHDLKEPLRKLISFSELLEQDLPEDLPEKAEKDLSFLQDATERMQNIVQSLLRLSRTRTDEMEREHVNLSTCVREAKENLDVMIEESEVEIQQDDLPEVYGDRNLLTRLYQNLISNAITFSDSASPFVHITYQKRNEQDVFGVRDNGKGIQKEYHEEIFKPFKTLQGRSESDGTGLGLAVCQEIVQRHNGDIWVESEPGNGAHFLFTLQTKET